MAHDGEGKDSEPRPGLTRRDFLKGAAIGTAAAVIAPAMLPALAGAASPDAPKAFAASEFQTLTALVDRLIPGDASGPGAVDAHAHVYIDLALAGEYRAALPAYKQNLAAIEVYAQKTYGGSLHTLPATTQDEVVTALELGKIPGVVSLVGVNIPAVKFALFPEIQGAFFSVLFQHTREGMFGDPLYGGNHKYAGWNLLGYPGVMPVVSAEDQAIGTLVPLAHRSAAAYGARAARWSLPEHPAPTGMGV